MAEGINTKNIIPVVFAVNKNYVPYLGVAIISLIKHVSEKYEYKVYVFHTTLSPYEQLKIQKLGTKNVVIQCINILEYTRNLNLYSSLHLTEETVYRILIPEVLPQFDKVVYLDSDLLVLKDIAELFEHDLEGKVLGVVHDVPFDEILKHVRDDLRIPPDNCFNAGVLLIDTKQFIEKNIKQKCIQLLGEDRLRDKRRYIYLDQDVLNIACREMTICFEPQWNFQWQYLQPERCERIIGEYREQYLITSEEPYIIHYAGDIKPWQEPDMDMADLFWNCARNTVFYEEIIYRNTQRKGADCFKTYLFPFNIVKASSNIILYGAGRVGTAFYEQLEQTGYCTVLAWVDKGFEKVRGRNPLVSSPKEIEVLPYEYVVIAIEDKIVAESIKKDLLKWGVNEQQIVWTIPRKRK